MPPVLGLRSLVLRIRVQRPNTLDPRPAETARIDPSSGVLDRPAGLADNTLHQFTPYTAEFDGADGGKQAHYMLRWVDTRGETGPWSETATATIGA